LRSTEKHVFYDFKRKKITSEITINFYRKSLITVKNKHILIIVNLGGNAMKMIVQLNCEDTKDFSKELREIAEKIDNQNLSGEKTEDECKYYFTTIDDTIDHRKFIVYSNDGYSLSPNMKEAAHPGEANNSQMLGLIFSPNMEDAFHEFMDSDEGHNHVSKGFKNFIIRETIGEPRYKNIG